MHAGREFGDHPHSALGAAPTRAVPDNPETRTNTATLPRAGIGAKTGDMLLRSSISLGCALGIFSALLDAPSAQACSRQLIEPFRIDRALPTNGSESPDMFRQVSAYTYRIESERCNGNACSASSCGDEGYLLVQFAPHAQAADKELGYRLVWLSGSAPPSLLRHLDRVMPLDPRAHEIAIDLDFKEITLLEGKLALVAVDHAGNESQPSEPMQVTWSGCTEYFDDPFCADGEVVVPPQAEQHCTLTTGPRAAHGLPLTAAAVLGLGAAACARGRRRKR